MRYVFFMCSSCFLNFFFPTFNDIIIFCRACFGTTKYCRAWLRNMVCEDIFSAYFNKILFFLFKGCLINFLLEAQRIFLLMQTCNNPDCLYLHDVGCQEDSFTKDEVISAYTR